MWLSTGQWLCVCGVGGEQGESGGAVWGTDQTGHKQPEPLDLPENRPLQHARHPQSPEPVRHPQSRTLRREVLQPQTGVACLRSCSISTNEEKHSSRGQDVVQNALIDTWLISAALRGLAFTYQASSATHCRSDDDKTCHSGKVMIMMRDHLFTSCILLSDVQLCVSGCCVNVNDQYIRQINRISLQFMLKFVHEA